MMALPPIGSLGAINLTQLASLYQQQVVGANPVDAATRATGAGTLTRGKDFGQTVATALREVEALDRDASGKAVQAATGDLRDIHDYVIAATSAQTATELTTTVRNKMLDAFNEIMRMPL